MSAYTKPRRVKPSAAARIRPFWMLVACLAIAFAALLVFAAVWPGFYPKRIVVRGNRIVSRDDIVAAAAIDPHRSIWLQNTGRIAGRIAAIPYVLAARVRRYPPGSIVIVVSERVPFAVLQDGGDSVLVDRALRVLAPAPPGAHLPILSLRKEVAAVPGVFVDGSEAGALRDAYDAMTRAGLAPAAIGFDRFGELQASLPGGPRLLLGDPENLAQKLRLSKAIVEQTAHWRRRVGTIDVRAPATPIVVYR